MTTRYQKIGATASLVAVAAMMVASVVAVAPRPVHALSTVAKINRVIKGDANYKKILIAQKAALAEEGTVEDIDAYYTFVLDVLAEVQDAAMDAKKKVPYVLFASLEEKQTLYAALSAIIAQIEVYERDVQAIYDQYTVDGDSAAAQVAFAAKNTEIVAYLEEHQDEFGEQIRAFLEAKLESSLAHTALSLTLLGEAENAYVDLGQDTTTLSKRLDQAQTAYDKAQELYTTGKETGDTKKLMQSAEWLLASRVVLLTAQGVVDNFEKTVIQ